jgi:hypothetical protein
LVTVQGGVQDKSGTDSCADLRAGQSVEVSGRQSGDRIVASTITVR